MAFPKPLKNRNISPPENNRSPARKILIGGFVIFFVIFWLTNRVGFCQEKFYQEEETSRSGSAIRKVALLPLENLSMSDSVPPDIIALMRNGLIEKKKVEVVPDEEVEAFLIKERIRDTGSISKSTARQMGKILGVDGIILTYLDLFASGEDPVTGIGCRMVSGQDGSVVWAGYQALAGKDFISWLGLGKISSLDILAKMAVEKLIRTFPAKMAVTIDEAAPFEITDIMVNPRSIRSSERIKVRIQLAAMGQVPYRITAMLGGQKRDLFSEGRRIYGCIFYAPLAEGQYPLRIEIRDREDNASVFESIAIIEVDNSPPEVVIYYQDKLFSPNRDKIKDTAIFFPNLNKPDAIASWSLIIDNSKGEEIRKAEGRAELPQALLWRGENDLNSIEEDGTYYFRLRVEDKAGNASETIPKPLILDKTPPLAQVTVSILGEEGYLFNLECRDKNGIDRWQLTIKDSDQRILQSFHGEREVPSNLKWATDPKNPADISYSFEVKDLAGNTRMIGPRSIKGELSSRKDSLPEKDKKKIEWDYDF